MPIQSAFTLNANEIFGTLANFIISQEVFADNIGVHQTLVDKARVDGSLFGDKKLYYATDALKTHAWGNDSEAANLLSLDRPADPKVQAITLNVFRQIRLTVDYYLTKRAYKDEGVFSSITSIMLGWMSDTKKIYEGTLYNVFCGTKVSSTGKQSISKSLTSGKEGQEIAQILADLLDDMADYTRSYNDYGFLRSYAGSSIKVIWNAKYRNMIEKVALPVIFHKEGLVEKLTDDAMQPRYFGTIITATNIGSYSASTPAAGKPIDSDDGSYVPGSNNANGTLRSVYEKEVTVSGTTYHLFPGDEIPSGATVKASAGDFGYGDVYIEDAKVICKVIVKYPPFMSAFEAGTNFFNPRSLTENHYLTFGHNTLEKFDAYPFITIKQGN